MDWRMDTWNGPCRFPHSDISGSMSICLSPKLFAAYHVFHRLSVPWASALRSLYLDHELLLRLFLAESVFLESDFLESVL